MTDHPLADVVTYGGWSLPPIKGKLKQRRNRIPYFGDDDKNRADVTELWLDGRFTYKQIAKSLGFKGASSVHNAISVFIRKYVPEAIYYEEDRIQQYAECGLDVKSLEGEGSVNGPRDELARLALSRYRSGANPKRYYNIWNLEKAGFEPDPGLHDRMRAIAERSHAERIFDVAACGHPGRHFARFMPPRDQRLPDDHICPISSILDDPKGT